MQQGRQPVTLTVVTCYRGGRVRPIRGFAVLVVNGEWGGGTAMPETVHVPIIQMRILASRIVVLLSSQRAASSGIHPLRKPSLVGYVTQGPRHLDHTRILSACIFGPLSRTFLTLVRFCAPSENVIHVSSPGTGRPNGVVTRDEGPVVHLFPAHVCF